MPDTPLLLAATLETVTGGNYATVRIGGVAVQMTVAQLYNALNEQVEPRDASGDRSLNTFRLRQQLARRFA